MCKILYSIQRSVHVHDINPISTLMLAHSSSIFWSKIYFWEKLIASRFPDRMDRSLLTLQTSALGSYSRYKEVPGKRWLSLPWTQCFVWWGPVDQKRLIQENLVHFCSFSCILLLSSAKMHCSVNLNGPLISPPRQVVCCYHHKILWSSKPVFKKRLEWMEEAQGNVKLKFLFVIYTF